jgi:uncharacterized protein DUF6600
MRTNRVIKLMLPVLFCLGCILRTARTAVSVDESLFYQRLAPYGNWTQHAAYGRVWHPTAVEAGWRPYTNGHWVATEEYGWMWDSDYEWGWAPFHYGRWFHDPDSGWLWVPGYEWGPAWVAWRDGGGYIGWAPLPPDVEWDSGVGLTFEDAQMDTLNLDLIFSRTSWVFVEERDFLAPRLRAVILEPEGSVTIFDETVNATRYAGLDGRIINRSIPVERIEKVTGRKVEMSRVNEENIGRPLLR